jgi:preprotein translocase subunit SecA
VSRPAVRKATGLRARLARWQGSSIEHDLSPYEATLAAINEAERALEALDDDALRERARELAGRARAGAAADALALPAFALVRQAARRVLGLRAFDEQVMAGLALLRGRVVEMQTGEGKTLAAVFPAFTRALAGRGLHVLTFNDYLARRDAEWMGPVYRLLGQAVGWIQGESTAAQRRAAYGADVTYVTAKEAGFDFLRDGLVLEPGERVHRPFQAALLDEADSLLIDEARVPLVIAGHADGGASAALRLAAVVAPLAPGLHFATDEYGRSVELTDEGLRQVEEALGCGSLHTAENYALLTELNCALHARALLRRDVDYIVRAGKIEIVDEFTGRVVDDRHWPDGLQAALEAKEGLARRPDGRILGSITLQHFLQLYPHVCGMTGTAQDAAPELLELYGLRVAVIPTHRPSMRSDAVDRLFTHREAKEEAVVEEVTAAHARGRPVLVGTLTVAESERLAARLRARGVPCALLNARHDAEEAAVVAGAGAPGAVTISTNMAGRGTDIRLGGADEREREKVVALGGLCVIGTNRHQSRRVDLQLRGRAGRQGDPGQSLFLVSLDDELMVRYGLRALLPERAFPAPQAEPVENPLLRREVARAQRIVEGQDFEIRRTLWRYAAAVEDQRQAVHERRLALLEGREEPGAWDAADPRRAALVERFGEEAVAGAERRGALLILDRVWREHLNLLADLREGIHLVRLGGGDPLSRFRLAAGQAFQRLDEEMEQGMEELLAALDAQGTLSLEAAGVKGPTSTWTYLVNDDPFRDQLGSQLTGPGRATLAMGAAVFVPPLLILLGLLDRFRRRKRPPPAPRA